MGYLELRVLPFLNAGQGLLQVEVDAEERDWEAKLLFAIRLVLRVLQQGAGVHNEWGQMFRQRVLVDLVVSRSLFVTY